MAGRHCVLPVSSEQTEPPTNLGTRDLKDAPSAAGSRCPQRRNPLRRVSKPITTVPQGLQRSALRGLAIALACERRNDSDMNHMKSSMMTTSALNRGGRLVVIVLVSMAAMSWTVAHAQPVFVPPVQYGDRVTTVEQASTNWVGSVAGPPLQAPEAQPTDRPLQLGPFRFHPHLGYQVAYGDGILLGLGNEGTTTLHTVLPGMFVQMGPYWDLDFTAAINRYSNAEFNNNEAFYLALHGHIPREKWLMDFGYQGAATEQPQSEVGQSVKQNAHRATASGIYNYQTRLSLELSGAFDARFAEEFSDYNTLSTLEWLNYQVSERTALGLGAGAGYTATQDGPDAVFEQLLGRVVWTPGSKFSFQASGGLQFQQFNGSGTTNVTITNLVSTNIVFTRLPARSGTEVTPIFGATVTYKLFEETSLFVSANRLIGVAYEENQWTDTTAFSAGVRQRLFGHISLEVVPSLNFTKYESTLEGVSVRREDEYFAVYAGLSTVLFRKLNALVFWQYTDNDSDLAGLSYVARQIGLRLEYRY